MSIKGFMAHAVPLDDVRSDDLVLCCDGLVTAVGVSLGEDPLPKTVWVIFLWSTDYDETSMLALADMFGLEGQPQICLVDAAVLAEAMREYRQNHPDDELVLLRDVSPSLIAVSGSRLAAPLN